MAWNGRVVKKLQVIVAVKITVLFYLWQQWKSTEKIDENLCSSSMGQNVGIMASIFKNYTNWKKQKTNFMYDVIQFTLNSKNICYSNKKQISSYHKLERFHIRRFISTWLSKRIYISYPEVTKRSYRIQYWKARTIEVFFFFF